MTSDHSLPGRPPVTDLTTWQAARAELLAREKAHTREGDALAAARRRLPMVEFDGTTEVIGADGPVPFLDLFQGRAELVVYKHMWHDGAPHQGQCEGCTTTAWHLQDATYLNARGVSFAILTTGRWEEVAPYLEFMGYTQPWYSVRDSAEPVGGDMGHLTCYLRDGDRTFLTYSTTGRGNERVNSALGLLDLTPYGRGEAWEDSPAGWPAGDAPCWYWRTDADGAATWGPTSRPVPQWSRPGAGPVRRWAGTRTDDAASLRWAAVKGTLTDSESVKGTFTDCQRQSPKPHATLARCPQAQSCASSAAESRPAAQLRRRKSAITVSSASV